jgi:hypothetical protein
MKQVCISTGNKTTQLVKLWVKQRTYCRELVQIFESILKVLQGLCGQHWIIDEFRRNSVLPSGWCY